MARPVGKRITAEPFKSSDQRVTEETCVRLRRMLQQKSVASPSHSVTEDTDTVPTTQHKRAPDRSGCLQPKCRRLQQEHFLRKSKSLIFPFLIRGGKPMPLCLSVLAFVFCTYNSYLQSRYLSQYAVYADDWITDPRFITGFVLWLVGLLINIHSDHILRNLRKPGETGYKIPRGGLFEYISAANYFGEVVEWCGYALASWSIQGGAFALFTFCFLFTRAQHHHQWYLEKFEDYPKFRKIIIPFLF
ncbi:hypothetical protein HPG69_003482 [Diceros bicornis minor]|uniref:3-oxo-5alpha-steroid 4-dehydrogenase (NADP(+)) n=1 Tax=Diceros bicornis minor TaxID=77932 RepID=A0A7J7EA11_DICBM|nr:hypothetical protein HPG69_003482 [Diceros bicornis minor]